VIDSSDLDLALATGSKLLLVLLSVYTGYLLQICNQNFIHAEVKMQQKFNASKVWIQLGENREEATSDPYQLD
jgi:hypothetical protein